MGPARNIESLHGPSHHVALAAVVNAETLSARRSEPMEQDANSPILKTDSMIQQVKDEV